MTYQNRLLAGLLSVFALAGCAPMETRENSYYDHPGEHQQYNQNDYRSEQDYRPGPDYRDDRAYQPNPASGYEQAAPYDAAGRSDLGCQTCGVVRSITQVAGSKAGNTGAIVVGALVGGALGNTIGHGDGRRAATVVGAVAGGAVANDMTRNDHGQHNLYRIDVHMDNGDMYSFDQQEHENLREGSPVEVRDGHVYPQE